MALPFLFTSILLLLLSQAIAQETTPLSTMTVMPPTETGKIPTRNWSTYGQRDLTVSTATDASPTSDQSVSLNLPDPQSWYSNHTHGTNTAWFSTTIVLGGGLHTITTSFPASITEDGPGGPAWLTPVTGTGTAPASTTKTGEAGGFVGVQRWQLGLLVGLGVLVAWF
ncbi:hypothetical protein EJ08DRAFT_644462 [Tothia fuscella]|uniref:Uncharacterized protein n=1 Tax=Tothia fuscella TaxID=1048955 RepID=A0A9P4P436_9PEZI|nr:hypothetical protein EJ08DRAFT_644462 [Tothia fuscella]